MRINDDFSKPAVVVFRDGAWVASPMAGVERRFLDRIGGEVARATSLVRYAPGSHFSAHTHAGGEEFVVLDGIFQDEHGDYPVGTYVRNPPTTSHTPRSDRGCVIFVKLHQFDLNDRVQTAIAMPAAGDAVLYEADDERVRVRRWRAGARIELSAIGGLELLVLEGALHYRGQMVDRWSWLREPGGRLIADAGDDGLHAWIKTGHLARPRMGKVRLDD